MHSLLHISGLHAKGSRPRVSCDPQTAVVFSTVGSWQDPSRKYKQMISNDVDLSTKFSTFTLRHIKTHTQKASKHKTLARPASTPAQKLASLERSRHIPFSKDEEMTWDFVVCCNNMQNNIQSLDLWIPVLTNLVWNCFEQLVSYIFVDM